MSTSTSNELHEDVTASDQSQVNRQSVTTVEHSKLLPWLMVCAILAGIAISMSCASMVMFYTATQAQIIAFERAQREQTAALEKSEREQLAAMDKTGRETRLLQYYLLELDSRVIRYGIKRPEEAIAKKLDEGKH